MKSILVYADSLSWGIIPGTRQRLPFAKRWPGVLEVCLNGQDQDIRIIENCLNGRRTAWDDPYKPGRNGAEGLAQVIEMHSPLALVILMLGTNDFQRVHDNNAWTSAQGMARLISIIKSAPVEPGMPVPEIMIISPPGITAPKSDMAEKFRDAEKKSAGLNKALQQVATEHSVYFFDAGTVIQSSKIDGVHLDEEQHDVLGKAIANEVKRLIFK